MILIKKAGLLLVIGVIILSIFREYALIIIAVWLLLKLIRFIADIFWWGKDGGRW